MADRRRLNACYREAVQEMYPLLKAYMEHKETLAGEDGRIFEDERLAELRAQLQSSLARVELHQDEIALLSNRLADAAQRLGTLQRRSERIERRLRISTPRELRSVKRKLSRSAERAKLEAAIRMQADDIRTLVAEYERLQAGIRAIEVAFEHRADEVLAMHRRLEEGKYQLKRAKDRGGIRAQLLFHILCQRGPFRRVDKALFARLLRRIGHRRVALIEQSPDGTLLLGRVGERIVEHYSFYAVFHTPEEYLVVFSGRPLGTIPTVMPLVTDMTIVFSGRRWRISAIHDRDKVVEVTKDATGRPPVFGGDHGIIDDAVVRRMQSVLEEKQVPRYLDKGAVELLREGRDTYRRLGLARRRMLKLRDGHHLVATWDGTIRTTTLALALQSHGFAVAVHDGFLDVEEVDRRPGYDRLRSVLRTLAVEPAPAGTDLASGMSALESEKFHRHLSRELLILDAVASKMSPGSVPDMARRILTNA